MPIVSQHDDSHRRIVLRLREGRPEGGAAQGKGRDGGAAGRGVQQGESACDVTMRLVTGHDVMVSTRRLSVGTRRFIVLLV